MSLIKSRRRAFIVLVCTGICGLIVSLLFANILSNTHEKIIMSRLTCLYMTPPVGQDELFSENKNETIDSFCTGDYGGNPKWDINFNVERQYSFRPVDFQKTSGFTLMGISQFLTNIGQQKKSSKPPVIPKCFHFLWSSEIIPAVFVENLKLFRSKHPRWVIHFWTLKSGRTFIEKHEPRVLKTYDKYKKDVARADALRYVLMYHIGGAYFDLDSKVLKPLDELTEDYECLIGPEPIENAVTFLKMRSLLANSGFLCRPRHEFFRFVIDGLVSNGLEWPGPHYLTKSFNSFLDKQLRSKNASDINPSVFDITVGPHDYFEYDLNKGVDSNMTVKCLKHKAHIEHYVANCLNASRENHASCKNIYEWLSAKILPRLNTEACVEWILHGGKKRKGSPRRFIAHEHYGTYNKKHLVFKTENDISRIIPDAVLHV